MRFIKISFVFFLVVFSSIVFAGRLAQPAKRLLQPAGTKYPDAVREGHRRIKHKINIYGSEPPARGEGIRIAACQSWGHGGTEKTMKDNLDRMVDFINDAKKYNVQLIAFPELYLPGYALTPEAGKKLAVTKDGDYMKKVQEVAKKYNIAIILPYAEKAKIKDKMKYFDAIAFVDNKGNLLESYRKTHLFGIAERLNWDAGDGPYNVYKINGFPVGILNCYEAEFPELLRTLALKGAKLVMIPTAADTYWKRYDGKWTNIKYPNITEFLLQTRAYSNRMFVSYIDYAGFEFLGKDFWNYQGNSAIADPHGKLLLAADRDQVTMLIADLIPKYYGPTHPENANYLRDRRPRLYGELTKTKVDFDGGHNYTAYPVGKYKYKGFPKNKVPDAKANTKAKSKK